MTQNSIFHPSPDIEGVVRTLYQNTKKPTLGTTRII